MNEDILKEVRELLEKPKPITREAKILYDEKTKQYSVKIPKVIAERAEIDVKKQKMEFILEIKNEDSGKVTRHLSAEVKPYA